MRHIQIYGFLLFSFFFTACEEEIFFSDDKFVPQIVLNSIFTNDSIWLIKLTHTTSIFDKSDASNYVSDAKIIVTDAKGESVCEFVHIGKGIYQSHSCKYSYEKEFKIFANSKKYGSVSSSSTIPTKAAIEYVKLKEVSELDNANEIEFQFKDQNIDNKYFIWSIIDVDTSHVGSGQNNGTLNSPLDIKTWVDDINDQAHLVKNGKLNSSLALSGEELEANDNTTSIFTTRKFYRDGETPPADDAKKVPMLRLMTVSEDLYQYYKSLEDYLKYNNNNASVIEPQKIYSNINGGYGIFAGYSIQYIPIQKS